MTANVDVITASATNVIIVPNAAVTTTGNTSTVTVLQGGKQVVKPVVIGLVGSSETELLSGVSVGATVVESTATAAGGATTGTSATGAGGGAFFRGGGGGGLFGGGGGLGG
jgi:macrolide-specific efflux system membrane fusion protein